MHMLVFDSHAKIHLVFSDDWDWNICFDVSNDVTKIIF